MIQKQPLDQNEALNGENLKNKKIIVPGCSLVRGSDI